MATTRLVLQSLFKSTTTSSSSIARCNSSSSRQLLLLKSATATATTTTSSRSYSSSSVLLGGSNDDLPYHIVVGMPALSPTMETGILAEWYVNEGSEFTAGQSLAKIETDKASIDFEAQDDGVVAKILMEAGSGDDIEVGTPIMVTIEEMEDLDAFKDFELEEEEEEKPAVEEVKEPEPSPAPAAVVAAAEPAVVKEPTPAAAAEPVHVTTPPPAAVVEELVAVTIAPVMSTGWGEFAKLNSPIIKTLSKQQQEYVEKYGTTGQVPL